MSSTLRAQQGVGFFAVVLFASAASAQPSATGFTPHAAAQVHAASDPIAYDTDYVETPQPRRSRALMLTGLLLFGISYSLPATAGVIIGTAEGLHFGGKETLRLLIPIAGPLTLLGRLESDLAILGAILVSDAVAQLTGLVMGIFGVVQYLGVAADEHGRAPAARSLPMFNVSIVPLPSGASVSLRATL